MRCVLLFAACFAVLAAACGGRKESTADKQPPEATKPAVTATVSVGQVASTAPVSTVPPTAAAKTTPVALKPSIEDALSCRVPATKPPGRDSGSGPFQRYTFDLESFPYAVCNDGSPGVLMFRPYEGEANRNKWLISLEGGGECSNGQECANRWCSVDTNFDSENMSSDYEGQSRPQEGILLRDPKNPWGNYNQVVVKFCTSDSWSGHNLGQTFDVLDPKTQAAVQYQMAFAGAYMYEATVDLLRKQRGTPLVFTRTNTPLPDLDDASEVIFAGGSGGGSGVIRNLDRLADTLRNGPNMPVVRGFIDAIVGPDHEHQGYASTGPCVTNDLCSYERLMTAVDAAQRQMGQMRWTDDSCIAWHQKNSPGTEWQCSDPNHVLSDHITTPYFVRMALTDAQRYEVVRETGYTDLSGKPFTPLTFGLALADTLNGLQAAVKAGHEGAAVTKLPGVFAPSCHTHYTLFDSDITYGSSVVGADGKTYRLFDVVNAWLANQKPDVVVTTAPRTDVCPGE